MIVTTFRLGGELSVRRLGFGAGRIVGPGFWGPPADEREAVAVLRRAVDRGANLIDTADNYGPGISEELVARALHPYRDGLVVATKGGVVRTGPDAWHTAGRPEQLRAACEASLRRLRVERLDLYQLHRIDPAVPLVDQVGALVELRDAGRIGHIGLDTVDTDELAAAREITDIASVQNRYNLADRSSDAVLAACEAAGIAFLPWFPLAAGALAAGVTPAAGGVAAAVAETAARRGATAGQVALAWLLHRSPNLLPTPGTASLRHLEENLDAERVELSDEDMRLLTDAAR